MSQAPFHREAAAARLVRVPLSRDRPLVNWLLELNGGDEVLLCRYEIEFATPGDVSACVAETGRVLRRLYATERTEQPIPVSATATWQLETRQGPDASEPPDVLEGLPAFTVSASQAAGPTLGARLARMFSRDR